MRQTMVCVCHGFSYDLIEKHHPRGVNSETITLLFPPGWLREKTSQSFQKRKS
jgi:hypothetical protein